MSRTCEYDLSILQVFKDNVQCSRSSATRVANIFSWNNFLALIYNSFDRLAIPMRPLTYNFRKGFYLRKGFYPTQYLKWSTVF